MNLNWLDNQLFCLYDWIVGRLQTIFGNDFEIEDTPPNNSQERREN